MFRLMSNPKSTHYNPDVAKALKDAAGKDDEQKTSGKDGDKKKKGRGGGSAGQKAKRKSRSKAKNGKGKGGKGKGRGKKRPRDGEDDDEDEDADGLEDDDAEDTACLHHHFRVKSKHLLFNFAPVQILHPYILMISWLQESDGLIDDEEGAEDPEDDIDEEEEDSI